MAILPSLSPSLVAQRSLLYTVSIMLICTGCFLKIFWGGQSFKNGNRLAHGDGIRKFIFGDITNMSIVDTYSIFRKS